MRNVFSRKETGLVKKWRMENEEWRITGTKWHCILTRTAAKGRCLNRFCLSKRVLLILNFQFCILN